MSGEIIHHKLRKELQIKRFNAMKIPQTLVEFPPFLTQSGCCTVRVLLVSLHHCWDDFIADFPLIKADCLGVLNQSKPPQEHANRAKGSSVH